jgi:oxygen-independent coproporphyrinogen-3 oxidase
LEANPDDLTPEKILQLADSPINRLSIGIQSFFEEDLKLMNRAHSSDQAMESLSLATRHFDNISIDLIYGMPNMSAARWKANIEKALSFNVPHISSYALTVEPKTALANFVKKGLVTPAEDEEAQAHFTILNETLTEAGYLCYEISNFGKPGYFSKNNSAYWQQKKYIGIGPSAHSFDGDRRGWNINNNPKYIKSINEGILPIETEDLSTTDKYNEYVMTGLRTIWGVSLRRVEREFGQKYREYLMLQADKFIQEHLLYLDGDVLLATKAGKFLADGIAADLFILNLIQDK